VPKDKRTFMSRMEIFQTGRPISAMMQGGTLRIMDAQRFRLTWTTDNWATKNAQDSTMVGEPGSFVDIQTAQDQIGSIVFTLFYPGDNRWLGRNYEVAVNEQPMPQLTAADKPAS